MAKTVKVSKVGRELPLNALRVLDACARCLSFTRAAHDLEVTQAAVSHQIKILEGYLGVRLFRRSGRGVILTQEGDSYMTAVREALTHLDEATVKLRAGRTGGSVTCSIATTIAMRWLVPRLGGFTLQYPDTTIRLDMTERFVNFADDNVDVAIRYGDGHWPGLVRDLLFREVLVPVCSPQLLKGRRKLARIKDLENHTLLHASASLQDWGHWLKAHGVTGIDSRQGLVFDQPHLALQAAAEGLGVAMADRSLVQRELGAGTLLIPLEGGLSRREGYYVVGTSQARDSLNVGRFWRWLMAQATAGSHQEASSPATRPASGAVVVRRQLAVKDIHVP
jgi:LysR family glycine cleavage system transcriptional activator